mgnify:CR=1 FL=1|jgi:hypothetical protein
MQVKLFKFLILFFFLIENNYVYAEYGDFFDTLYNYKDHNFCSEIASKKVRHMPKGSMNSDNDKERLRYWLRHDKIQDIYFDCRLDRELGY